MSRPVYTAIYSLMIIGIFFSLSIIYQSCGNNKSTESPKESIGSKVEDVADNYTEDSFFEDDEGVEETDQPEETPDGNTEDNDSREVVQERTPVRTPSANSSSISPGGFVVIAGNYLLEGNADNMVRNLQSAGFRNAQKVVFDLSQYHTVIAGRYETRSEANSASGKLKDRGIDNYVLRRN